MGVGGEDRPLRVLFLSISFHPEPGAMHGLPLMRWLRDQRGYEVEALTAIPWYPHGRFYPGYRVRPVQHELIDGIRVRRVPLWPSHDSSAARRIATYASFAATAAVFGAPGVRRPDVVYYYDNLPTTGSVARLIARFSGARTVQHVADLWPDTILHSGMIRRPALRSAVESAVSAWVGLLYRSHARITVLSPGFKRILVERGVDAGKIEVVYNWVDEAQFFPVPRDEQLAQRLGLAGRTNIVYAGNIGPLQSVETVLRAAERLRDRPDVQFVIAGAGPREAAVRALAAELALPNVRLLGRLPLEEMNSFNALADAMVIHLQDRPALRATIPGKTQVALAAGRPVLAGVRGDAADLVSSAEAGFPFEPENSDSLADTVRRFLALAPEQRAAMGRRGREYYLRELSLEAGASRMDRTFRAAVAP